MAGKTAIGQCPASAPHLGVEVNESDICRIASVALIR
jgi:hypothetical protein